MASSNFFFLSTTEALSEGQAPKGLKTANVFKTGALYPSLTQMVYRVEEDRETANR